MKNYSNSTDPLATVSASLPGRHNVWVGVIGSILICASPHVYAQICAAEIERSINAHIQTGVKFDVTFSRTMWSEHYDKKYGSTPCAAAAQMFAGTEEYFTGRIAHDNDVLNRTGRPGGTSAADVPHTLASITRHKLEICFARARLDQCSKSKRKYQ